MSMRLTWRGADIGGRVNDATKIGIDRVLADCVAEAQSPYPRGARRDIGTMANMIKPVWAIRQGSKFVGRWGNVDGPDYALIWEIRDKHLRRAADAHYPSLADRIQKAYQ